MQVALQEQRHESNAASARQLKLIDRLRADKEALAGQAAELAHELKVLFVHDKRPRKLLG